MLALTVVPGAHGTARLSEMPEPEPSQGEILVEALMLGICGTDREILSGAYGTAPAGQERLILGHESFGRVLEAPAESGFSPGDLVVGIVRHPDPVPCPSCARGKWDMCQNGQYTEHGIKQLHGFAAERYRLKAGFAVRVDPSLGERAVLTEPASILAKAWDHIDRIGHRSYFCPQRVLITGAGPIGLLAALFGVQRGLEVHVFDRHEEGPKPELTRALGARYHAKLDSVPPPDLVLECTGAPELVVEVMCMPRANGIVCLTGVSSGTRKIPVAAGKLGRELVLENNVVFGTVNANRAHYEEALRTLARANASWLDRLITRRVPLQSWQSALEKRRDDVKTVLVFR